MKTATISCGICDLRENFVSFVGRTVHILLSNWEDASSYESVKNGAEIST